MKLAIRALVLAASVASLVMLAGCGKDAVSDRQFGDKVHAYLMAHPEVLRETAAALDKKDAQDRARKVASIIDRDRVKLERDSRDIVINPTGKITVVQFFDYNCGYCKVAAPQVLALIKARPDVRFVFKDWPVVGGAESVRAAKVAYGLRTQKGDGLGLYRDFIAARPLDSSAMFTIAAAKGLDAPALEQAAEKAGVEDYLADTSKIAHDLGLDGTPAFVVGDTLIDGSDIDRLKAAIARASKA